MSTLEKVALSIGIYAAVMAAVAVRFQFVPAYANKRGETGDPHYD